MSRRLLLITVLLLGCLVGARAFLIRDDSEEGTLEISGLKHPVRIVRDQEGIPHIYAEDSEDLALAFGFAEARDRLFQLDLNRHVLSGTLASFLGEPAVRADLFYRTIGLREAAGQALAQASPEARRELEAFARGVNAYAESHKLPLEFALTGHSFEPLEAVDCAGTGILLAWQLSLNLSDEIRALKIAASTDPSRLPELFPEAPETILPGEAGANRRPIVLTLPEEERPLLARLSSRELGTLASTLSVPEGSQGAASNNWAVGGERSASGKPLLANDPHLALGLPSIWYEAHLVAPGLDVVGAAVPGLPYVEIGHNKRIAFGFTNVTTDNQDLYLEELNPANANEVRFEGGFEPLRRERVAIAVKGRAPILKDILYTRHGPLLNDIHPELGKAAALTWIGHRQVGHTFDGLRKLDRAGSWEEARAAVREFSEISLNLIYADVDGNIGWQVSGSVPIRAKGDGRFPALGWTGESEWTGTIPFNELPSYFLPKGEAPVQTGSRTSSPPTHLIATANQRSVHRDYPYHLSSSWAAPYRFLRVSELLAGEKKLTLKDLEAVQGTDTPSSPTCSFHFSSRSRCGRRR